MKSLSQEVERAEKLVHGKLIKRLGQERFDKAMKDPWFRANIDKTVLQQAGCILPESILEENNK